MKSWRVFTDSACILKRKIMVRCHSKHPKPPSPTALQPSTWEKHMAKNPSILTTDKDFNMAVHKHLHSSGLGFKHIPFTIQPSLRPSETWMRIFTQAFFQSSHAKSQRKHPLLLWQFKINMLGYMGWRWNNTSAWLRWTIPSICEVTCWLWALLIAKAQLKLLVGQ